MSREHAHSAELNKQILISISCDGCGACVSPEEYRKSSWKKSGVYYGAGDPRNAWWDWCEKCAEEKSI